MTKSIWHPFFLSPNHIFDSTTTFFSEDPKGPNDLCPRRNGFYAHPDPGVCNVFYACVDGVAEEYTCSQGLWFDEYQGVCNWPGATDRKNCNAGMYSTYCVQQCAATI